VFKVILRKIGLLGAREKPIDPKQFGDPLALTTEWTPASRGGSNFRTHKLIQIDSLRVEFHASAAAKVFYTIFGLAGLAFMVAFSAGHRGVRAFSVDAIVPFLAGLIFATAGGAMMYTGTTPIVFDKATGYFWKGRKSPQDVPDVQSLKKCVQLVQIHALQLVSEYVRSGKSSYYSYELNLVLEDASRMTVIDHGNLVRLREDARKLSEFLGKPVWDAIDRGTPLSSTEQAPVAMG
jgi:hypothetical protein